MERRKNRVVNINVRSYMPTFKLKITLVSYSEKRYLSTKRNCVPKGTPSKVGKLFSSFCRQSVVLSQVPYTASL